MSMGAAEIVTQLDGRRAGDGWLCRCPLADEHSNGDRNPSFTVVERDGKVLVRCQSRHADEQDRVIDALRARGLWPINENGKRQPARASRTKSSTDDQWELVSPVPADAPDSDISAKHLYSGIVGKGGDASRFDYLDLNGQRLFSVYRFEPPSAPKEIRPLSLWRDLKTGALCWRAKWPPAPLPLFGLERLSKYQADAPVLLCEGEKKTELAADTLGKKFVVLSIPSGAKSIDRIDLSPLDGRRVTAWPDNDRPGFDAMASIARKLEQIQIARDGRISNSVQLVNPDAAWPAGHDVGDLINAGWDATRLLEYIAKNSVGVENLEHTARQRFSESATPAVAESEVDRLAKLSALEYDRARKDAAKQMGVRPATLDAEVAKLRPKPTQEHESLAPPAPIPWAEPVAGAPLLVDLYAFIKRFIVVEGDAYVALALWVIFSHLIDVASTSPRLAITSPTMRCGKTLTLDLLEALSYRPVAASNLSPAAVYRTIELERCSLLIDEADAMPRKSERGEELRGLLNAGHTRTKAYVIRNVKHGDDWIPKKFATFAPIAVAAIGELPATWADRSIAIPMRRKPRSVRVERLIQRNKDAHAQAAILCSKIARFAADNKTALAAAEPDLPPELNDRQSNNWEMLFAIADLAGGRWPGLARTAAVKLSADRAEVSSLGEQLMIDIKTVFDQNQCDRISSVDLCSALHGMEARPWLEFGRKQKPISQSQLARQLRHFGVVPGTIRIGDETPKGYTREAFVDAFSRYTADPPDTNRHTATTAGTVERNGDFQGATKDSCCTSEKRISPYAENDCGGVAAPNEENRGKSEISDSEKHGQEEF